MGRRERVLCRGWYAGHEGQQRRVLIVVPAADGTKPAGLGLGLSICRSIIEAHDGRLSAAANQARGAVFQFTLPVPTP